MEKEHVTKQKKQTKKRKEKPLKPIHLATWKEAAISARERLSSLVAEEIGIEALLQNSDTVSKWRKRSSSYHNHAQNLMVESSNYFLSETTDVILLAYFLINFYQYLYIQNAYAQIWKPLCILDRVTYTFLDSMASLT